MTAMSETDHSVLRALFQHNTWANLKLLDFCEGLSDEQLDTAAVGGFGTIRATLRHIVGAETSYVRRVNGKQPTNPVPRDHYPPLDLLKEAARWTGGELLQLAMAARDIIVEERHTEKVVEQYPVASLMVQAINHSTEHRTQVATIITQLGLEPPDMSGWQYMVETGEYRETAVEG